MKFEFLKAKNILPKGWLLKQLQTQADGLNGNLDKVWKDVYDSKWLGGNSEGWERLPYFLDGYIPLAYLLRDKDKIARAEKYVNCILERQAEDGCYYPAGEKGKSGDIWSLFLIAKVLTVYADCSGDEERIADSLYRFFRFLDGYINGAPPFGWAQMRWYECVIPIMWLYRRRKEDWLLRLAKRLKTCGADFETAIGLWKEVDERWRLDTHVVNIAMALKSEAVYCEATGEKLTGLAERMLKTLFRYHGTAYGHFSGDECLSGNSPIRGSELCGIVEAMYSYEWLTAVTGDPKWGDLLEKLAFNALPAACSTDMWVRQYDQQVNQIACIEFENKVFYTNSADGNMFGLEPQFGCCTANFGQGFPKFALSAYMTKGDKLVVISPVPAEITMDNGVKIECRSDYPFRDTFSFTASESTKILLRVPAFTKPECSARFAIENGYMELTLPKGVSVTVCFPAKPVLTDRPEGRKCLYYGNLLFSLPITHKAEKLEYVRDGVERKFPYCDYSLTPVGEWRYAFAGDEFSVAECDYDFPFDRSNPPLKIKAQLAPVQWNFEEGHDMVAATKAGTVRTGEKVDLNLQPYGATYLRITEMAKVK